MNEIEKITMDCMIKKKSVSSKNIVKPNPKDVRFYRKRIQFLLKQYINDENIDIFQGVKHSLDSFLLTSISYFKTIDKTEIFQKDYLELELELEKEELEEDIEIKTYYPFQEEEVIIPCFSFKEKPEIKTMDHYVKRIITKEEIETFYPHKKKANIKSKDFKNKGIIKKNIVNTYDNGTKE
jgi:hypothetical protein